MLLKEDEKKKGGGEGTHKALFSITPTKSQGLCWCSCQLPTKVTIISDSRGAPGFI